MELEDKLWTCEIAKTLAELSGTCKFRSQVFFSGVSSTLNLRERRNENLFATVLSHIYSVKAGTSFFLLIPASAVKIYDNFN